MNKHLKYLSYVIRHKWYVMLACFQVGLYWRGLKHDLSKLLPCEWFPYVEYFYGEKLTVEQFQDNRRRELNLFGTIISKHPDQLRDEFDRAWLHHQHANSHHWQHWVLREDRGDTKILRMPYNDALEMVCDWRGAGMAINGRDEVQEWYGKNRDIIQLHPETRRLVEDFIYGMTFEDWVSGEPMPV